MCSSGRALIQTVWRAAQKQRVGFGVRDDAAGGRDHRRIVLVDDAFEAGALVAAEGREPGHLDQIGNARAVVLLDQAVELDEGAGELIGKTPSQRRLAGAAQPDERDAPRAVGRDMPGGVTFDQLGQRGKLRDRRAGEHVEHMGHRRRTAVRARQELDDRNVERLRDRLEDEHGRIALPAFDLREVALGRARTPAPVAAASCRVWRARAAPAGRCR